MSKVSIKGVLLGGITDIVATNLLVLPIVVYVMTRLDLARMSSDQATAATTAAMLANPWLFAAEVIIGVGCSVLGGYVAARIAKHDELLNGLLSCYLCLAFGLYSWIWGKTPDPGWMHVLGFVASPAASLLGGQLRLVQKRSRSEGPGGTPLPGHPAPL